MKKSAIVFEKVTKSWQTTPLFRQLSFDIKTGTKAVLIGPSGIGKSTILNMILGFVRLDSGQIRVQNQELSRQSIAHIRRICGYIPQMPRIGEGLIRDCILFPFSFKQNQSLIPSEQQINQHLQQLGLKENILENKASEISGGQSQRIAILIVKLLQRKVILLDEPTSALDPENKKLVLEYLLNDPGLTVLSVSHDQDWNKCCNQTVKIRGPYA